MCSSLLLPFTEGFAANKKFIPRMSEMELSALKAKAEAEPGQWVVHKSTALEPYPPWPAAYMLQFKKYGARKLEREGILVRICVCLRRECSVCLSLLHAGHMLVT